MRHISLIAFVLVTACNPEAPTVPHHTTLIDYNIEVVVEDNQNDVPAEVEEPTVPTVPVEDTGSDCAAEDMVPWFFDGDGDGYGGFYEAATSWTCTTFDQPSPNYVLADGDCNDADPLINPGADELIGDVTDNDCDGFEPCSFPVEMADGSIVDLPNELQLFLNPLSPSGLIDPTLGSYQEHLRFDVVSLHAECPALTFSGGDLLAFWSENAPNSSWTPTGINIYNLSTIGMQHALIGAQQVVDGLGTVMLPLNVEIPGGETYTFAVYANTDGASYAYDDSLVIDFAADSLDYGPVNGPTYHVANDPVLGYNRVF